ncbi:hypothetical protein ACQPYA_29645 [Micromonospora sp. CA-263727]|uniref:hypothetical protein n=1 Tax=Micromonospora sp. CA-263727 TaxID=3239967 RepID=UPI003D93F88F
MPGEPDSYNFVVARWLDGPLTNHASVLEQMISRLRPGGWLVLADITPTPPRTYRATDSDTDGHLIHTAMTQIHNTITNADGGTWGVAVDALLAGNRMTQICARTASETWAGGGPGCRLLAETAQRLRPTLTDAGLTDPNLDRFVALMTNPHVLLGCFERRVIHARKGI